MHQDQRIGLALGILLLGAAGAFFFRNDPNPTKPGPRLKTARAVDARIAEKSLSPYLQSIKDDESPSSGSGSRRARDGIRDNGEGNDGRLPSFDDPVFSSIRNDSTADRNSNRFPIDRSEQNLTPIPIDDGDEIVTQDGSLANAGTSRSSQSERIHVVQKGESLSSISAKELGSANRFMEIFEANRDQLKNANDVRIGMSLRILSRETTASANSNIRSNQVAPPLLPSQANNGDEDDRSRIGTEEHGNSSIQTADDAPPNKGKFEPAKSLPLGVQGLAAPGNTPRRLSQIPPKDTGGKVAR